MIPILRVLLMFMVRVSVIEVLPLTRKNSPLKSKEFINRESTKMMMMATMASLVSNTSHTEMKDSKRLISMFRRDLMLPSLMQLMLLSMLLHHMHLRLLSMLPHLMLLKVLIANLMPLSIPNLFVDHTHPSSLISSHMPLDNLTSLRVNHMALDLLMVVIVLMAVNLVTALKNQATTDNIVKLEHLMVSAEDTEQKLN